MNPGATGFRAVQGKSVHGSDLGTAPLLNAKGEGVGVQVPIRRCCERDYLGITRFDGLGEFSRSWRALGCVMPSAPRLQLIWRIFLRGAGQLELTQLKCFDGVALGGTPLIHCPAKMLQPIINGRAGEIGRGKETDRKEQREREHTQDYIRRR